MSSILIKIGISILNDANSALVLNYLAKPVNSVLDKLYKAEIAIISCRYHEHQTAPSLSRRDSQD